MKGRNRVGEAGETEGERDEGSEATVSYEPSDGGSLGAFLEKAAYICDIAHGTGAAKKLMEENEYDFLLLDLGLPDGDGLELLGGSKKLCPGVSCIIITARGNVEDRIKGLDLGADDYLANPFSLLEMQ